MNLSHSYDAPPPKANTPTFPKMEANILPKFRYVCPGAMTDAEGLASPRKWKGELTTARVDIRTNILRHVSNWSRGGRFHVTIHIPPDTKNLTVYNRFFLDLLEGLIIKKIVYITSFGAVRGDVDLKYPTVIVVNKK